MFSTKIYNSVPIFFNTVRDNVLLVVSEASFLSRLGKSNVMNPDKRNAIAFIYIAISGVLAINKTPAIAGPIKMHQILLNYVMS